MEAIFPIAGAALVLLEVASAVTKRTERFLPIGGSHVTQIGVVFGLAYVVHEFIVALH
jgi:hypothetical protein